MRSDYPKANVQHTGLFLLVFLMGSWSAVTGAITRAEERMLVVHVEDAQKHPLSGMQIGVKGDGGSSVTTDDGKARIRLAQQTKPGSWVSLQILKSPRGKDFVLNSPWNGRTLVPSFENESENFVEVVVVQRGDRAALENGNVLTAMLAQIIHRKGVASGDGGQTPHDDQANVTAVAKQYGLTAEELDSAIRTSEAKTTDTYQAGLSRLLKKSEIL
jgi:hypothetical protein